MLQVPHNPGPSLLWAIPTLGRPVPLEWALNFKSMSPPINFNVDFSIIYNAAIADARNSFVEHAKLRGCKYLFFLGDDVVAPAHTLRQLIYRMENQPNVDVVGGVYCAKADPAAPLVFVGNGQGTYWDWKIGEFFEVTGLGMDCTLIRMSVFDKLEKPYFKTVDEDNHIDGQPKAESWTEDLYFLKKVSDAGFRIWCDASVICDHWDVYARRAYSLPKDSLPLRQKLVTGEKKCLMLGQPIGLTEPYDVTRCSQENDRMADFRVRFDNLPFDADQFDFIVVTDKLLDIDHHVKELLRVAKVGAKIAFNLNPRLNKEHILLQPGWTADGDFVEIMKT